MALKKIDKLKNSPANRIAKEKKKSANLPSFSSLLRTERSYLIHAITLRGATTLCARLDIKDTRTSLFPCLPPLIYDEAIEKSPRLSAILYPQLVLDATRFFRRLKVASSTPFAILSSSSLSLGSPVDKGGWITGGEETISRGASVRSAHVSLVDNAKPARVHNKLLAKLTVLFVTPENEISCFEAEATWSGKEGKESGRNRDIL